MATLAGIRQSVDRANRLMDDTGFMDSDRGLSNDAWDHNIAEARRELAEVADALAGRHGPHLYRQMNHELRRRMWRAVLLSSCNAGEPEGSQFDITNGCRIMRSIGGISPGAVSVLEEVTNELASLPTGFPVRVLRTLSRRFRESAPGAAAEIERRARLAGDPMPVPPLPRDSLEYMRIMLRALSRARAVERSWDAHHPKIATFVAVAASYFGVPTEQDAGTLSEYARDRATSDLEEMIHESTHIKGVMGALGHFDTLHTGVDTYRRLTDPEERLRQGLREVALAECDDSPASADALIRRMEATERRMTLWLEWLSRHRDHPAYTPPGGVIENASPSLVRVD